MNRISMFFTAAFAASGPAFAADLSPVETLGKSLFFDTELSVNGNQACASCHSPDMGFTSPHGHFNAEGAVVQGSVEGLFGNRKPPSAAYASETPVFHHILDGEEPTFVGGAFLDGRATGKLLGSPIADQAEGPFLNPREMGLPHAACVVAKVLNPANPSAYPVTLKDIWGRDLPDITLPADLAEKCADPAATITLDEATEADVEMVFGKIAHAIAAFERSAEVNAFTSRYDRWVHGEDSLSPAELAGMEIFVREDKGNCAACHILSPSTGGKPAVMTDWTFDNLGVPRNRFNPFYAATDVNPEGDAYVDPGLGGYLRTDPIYASYADDVIGAHQVPTLRNLTKGASADAPKAFMHNGYFKTLEGIVHFYNTRDVLPRCENEWASEAEAMQQGCWPRPEVEATMNKDELGDLKLTAAEEAELVAFLKAFDDE